MARTEVKIPTETLMYSIHPRTGDIITHHLPFARESEQLDFYVAKGFTFEKPVVDSELFGAKVIVAGESTGKAKEAVIPSDKPKRKRKETMLVGCVVCKKPFKGMAGLKRHMRSHVPKES